MNHELLSAYVQALLPERERYLYQHALNKVRVITRSMKPAEKEAYLRSEAFQALLRQLQRRDRVWQGLLHSELTLSGDRAEFDRLAKLIEKEMQAGRKIDLAFLRTVEKSKVSLEKAYEAIRIVREGDYYHDPGLSEEEITWQYAVVPKDFEFPTSIRWELLDECFISEHDPDTRSDGIDWAAVEEEAFRLTGNGDLFVPQDTRADGAA